VGATDRAVSCSVKRSARRTLTTQQWRTHRRGVRGSKGEAPPSLIDLRPAASLIFALATRKPETRRTSGRQSGREMGVNIRKFVISADRLRRAFTGRWQALAGAESSGFPLGLALVALVGDGRGWTCCVPDVYPASDASG
jgi:hypothetical protein